MTFLLVPLDLMLRALIIQNWIWVVIHHSTFENFFCLLSDTVKMPMKFLLFGFCSSPLKSFIRRGCPRRYERGTDNGSVEFLVGIRSIPKWCYRWFVIQPSCQSLSHNIILSGARVLAMVKPLFSACPQFGHKHNPPKFCKMFIIYDLYGQLVSKAHIIVTQIRMLD